MKNKRSVFCLIPISTLILLFSFCTSKKHITHFDRQNDLKLAATLGGWVNDTNASFFVEVEICNPTSDTIIFTSMKCSYWAFFVTDTSALEVKEIAPCFSNTFYIVKLPPGKKKVMEIMIQPTKKELMKDIKKFRVGMYILKPKGNIDFDSFLESYEKRELSEKIWSNKLDLEKLPRKKI